MLFFLVVSVGLAWLLYRFVEMPMMRVLRPRRRAAPAPAPAAEPTAPASAPAAEPAGVAAGQPAPPAQRDHTGAAGPGGG
jgi:predicted lipid-binding transport protein (Tim44 family)